MRGRAVEESLERTLGAPRPVVWGLVADTNRWDRAAELAPGTYRWAEIEGRWQQIASARQMGFDLEWVEPPYQWVEGRFLEGHRRFTRGPSKKGGFAVRLEDAGGGKTRVRASFFFCPSGSFGAALRPVIRSRFRRALVRYLDAIEELLDPEAERTGDAFPAAVQARLLLLQAAYDPLVSGPRQDVNHSVLEARARLLRQSGLDPEIVDRLKAHLELRPDEEVRQMRPFELARAWKRDRRAVLRAFLHGTRAGLVDLRWQVNCPVCRVSAQIASSLTDVRSRVHCEACRIDYDSDFGEHVEAVFQCNASLRKVETAVYCAASPAFRPHVLAQIRLEPGQRCEHALELPRGPVLVRTLDRPQRVPLDASAGPGTLRVRIDDGNLEARFEPGEADVLEASSGARAEAVILVERAGWAADAVLGTVVASFPEFLDLFATEAPAAGVDLSISHLAVLFSDLTDSTAMYGSLGDARAFAAVQEHFRIMGSIVERHEGAIVKTMGDAVMASFSSSARAVRAALDMIREHAERTAEPRLGVKLGLHAGPCLAVRANERLDFFGTTVNLAARLQGAASHGELVVTEGLSEDPTISPLLEGLEVRAFESSLKGIDGVQRLVAYAPPAASPAVGAASLGRAGE